MVNESRTTSILQRAPVILAVTAASYGLPAQANGCRPTPGARRGMRGVTGGRAARALDLALRAVIPHH